MKYQTHYQIQLLKIILLLSLMAVTTATLAQSGIDADAPPTENEIICYAAQKKWVCAPADQKQQAHDKAMKLAANKQATELIEKDSSVEIKTMAVDNDFSQQVQELPTESQAQPSIIDEQIKDFIPRQEVEQASEPLNNVTNTPSNVSADQAVEPQVEPVIEQQSAPSPQVRQSTPETVIPQLSNDDRNTSNNFADWQVNHAAQWSFQVIGTSNRHHLDQFITTHGLQNGPHTIVKTTANGADWWVVLVGLYDNRDQAISQKNQLPTELTANAWVRQIKTIVGEADRN